MTAENPQQSVEKHNGATADGSQQELVLDYSEERITLPRLRFFGRWLAENLSEVQWLLPAVGVLLGALVAVFVSQADNFLAPNMWAIAAGEARSGLLSGLSILFAGLGIVLALASVTIQNVIGRFSLRMLRIYLRDPVDKVVIAAFAMAATFMLLEWFHLRMLPPDAVAPGAGMLVAGLLMLVSAATMIWYLSHLTSWFRLSSALQRVTKQILKTARSVEDWSSNAYPAAEYAFERPPDAVLLPAHKSGFLTDLDLQRTYDLAVRNDVEFVIDREMGASVVRGEPIGWIVAGESRSGGLPSSDQVEEIFDITQEREMDLAVWYGIVVLVDIAIMALSPSVNDPNTAVQVVEEMAVLFPQLARFRLGPVCLADAKGRQRVAVRISTLGSYIELATTQIILYGSQDPEVIKALRHLVAVLETLELTEDSQEVVKALALRIHGFNTTPTEVLPTG
jgi:uncharacterized membrane protein